MVIIEDLSDSSLDGDPEAKDYWILKLLYVNQYLKLYIAFFRSLRVKPHNFLQCMLSSESFCSNNFESFCFDRW